MSSNPSFYFYDLETTGLNPASDRIVQFAGQRVNLNFEALAEPDNILIKLTPDILPHPQALLVSGISPQQTLSEGISEAEFLKYFNQEIATEGTIFVGFNNINFDDDFIRYLNYRNFSDPYTWQWQDNRSKWDIYSLVIMTRALRPEGLEWPVAENSKAVNRLEEIAKANKLDHFQAHDALSDVQATIALARLIKEKQPKLFKFLLDNRSKTAVSKLINSNQPFIYSGGPFSSDHAKTSAVISLGPTRSQADQYIYYDLRVNPKDFVDLSIDQLKEVYLGRYDKDKPSPPFGLIKANKCPALAPLNVLRTEDQDRLDLNLEIIEEHLKILADKEDFADKLTEVLDSLNKAYPPNKEKSKSVDEQMYDGFFNESDKTKMAAVRAASPEELADLSLDFSDTRLGQLLPLYKARNYPQSLNQEENIWWQNYLKERLLGGDTNSRASQFFAELEAAAQEHASDSKKSFLITEMQLYAESILPLGDLD